MSRLLCLVLLGHVREVVASHKVALTSDTFEGDCTELLYRCRRCGHLWHKLIRGDWSPHLAKGGPACSDF